MSHNNNPKKLPIIQRKNVQSYLKYSGIGFQMVGILLLTWYIGSQLDARYDLKTPYWTAGLMLGGIVFFLVSVFIQILKDEKQEK